MQATKMAFEQRYSNDSGVKFAVRLDADGVEFEAWGKITFPAEELDWLLAALTRIKDELALPVGPMQ